MKRLLAWILAFTMCLSMLSGCVNKDTTDPTGTTAAVGDPDGLKNAIEYLKTLYREVDEATPRSYQRIGTVPVGSVKYEIVWSVDVSEDIVKIVRGEDGLVTIEVCEGGDKDIPYVLTATITDAAGNTETISWNHVIPAAINGNDVEIVDMAYALENGESLPNEATLTGVIISIDTPWSEDYQNITVTIAVPGREDKPIQCYRLTGDGAKDLGIGDTITVTGTLKNYNGTIEFDAGCILEAVEKGEAVEAPEDPLEIVDAAYDLDLGASLPYEATLTGEIISVDSAWSSQYGNITVTIQVAGRENKPIQCYRLSGAGAESLKVTDVITVKGYIKNYNGTIEFTQGCTLLDVVPGAGVKAPSDPRAIVDAAYNLAPYKSLPYTATLTGTITQVNYSYSETYGDITVTMVVAGREGKPIQCYRMTGSGVDVIGVGDTITVRGTIKNYYNTETGTSTIEFDRPALISYTHVTVAGPTDPAEIMADIKNLGAGETTAYDATLTGKITEVNTPYSSQYGNVTVTIEVDGTNGETILCYRIKGTGADVIDVGDTITVTGKITNYMGNTLEFVAGSKLVSYVKGTGSDDGEEDDGPSVTYNPVVVETPAAATAYKLGVAQNNLNGTVYYFSGKLSNSFYLGTTDDPEAAMDVFLEEAEGGYKLYFLDGETKTYINITERTDKAGSANVALSTTEATVYAYNSDADTLVAAFAENSYYMGTYNTFSTISASNVSYIYNDDGTLDTEAMETANFVAHLMTLEVVEGPATLEEAAAQLKKDYPNGYGDGNALTGSVTVRDDTFPVTWTVETENTAAVKIENGVLITTSQTEDVPFKLIATITAADGTTTTLTWEDTVIKELKTPEDIVNAAYGLASGETLEGTHTLTGVITSIDTAYSEQYGNITVTIVVGDLTDKPIQCYRLSSSDELAAELATLAVTDTITVTGTLTNYNGTVEFTQGCTLDAVVKGEGEPDTPVDPDPPVVTAPFADGDQVVIYAPAYNKALSAEKTGNYNVGVDVTLTDGVLSGYGETEIWTVIANDDGTYSFANGGQNLGMADSYSSVNLGAVNDDWALTDLGNGLYLVRNTVRENYLEWYATYSNWSTYNSDSAATDDQFQLAFYVIPDDDEPVDPDTPVDPDPPVVTAPFADGDQVVIYAPAYNKALSAEKTGNYNVGVDVTLTDGVLSGYGENEIWTVIANDDGTYSFANGGQNLGMADSYSSVNLGAVNDDWALTDLGNGLYLVRNTVRENYLEWYASYSNWSTYNSDSAATDDQFQLAFYVIPDDDEPVDPDTPVDPDVPVAPTDPVEIVNAAYALEEGTSLDYTATLTGVIKSVDTAYSEQYGNITVTIVVGDMTDKPIQCYRMVSSEDLADELAALAVTDTITVTGTLKNHYGIIEFDAGCTLDAVVKGPGVTVPENTVTYRFSEYPQGTQYAENEVHVLDDTVTVITNLAHFREELRLYSSATYNSTAIIESTKTIESIVLNVGNKVDTLNVYGSTDGENWTLIQAVSITNTSYNDYTVDMQGSGYTYLKLDVEGTQQLRIKYMTITFGADASVEPDTSATVEEAAEQLKTEYPNGYGENNTLTASVTVGEDSFTVTWTVETENTDAVKIENGVLVTVPQAEDVAYKLIATITAADGTTTTVTWEQTVAKAESSVPTTPEDIVNAAYALEEGTSLDYTATLTGVIKSVDAAYSEQYGNITVTIIVGDMTDKPIQCYRMVSSEDLADELAALAVTDTITVTGTLKNHYGTIEFDTGCTLDAVVKGPGVTVPENTVTYRFSEYPQGTQYAENEVHVLDDTVTVITNLAHFREELRLYSSATYNSTAIIESTKTIESIVLNVGNKVDTLNVYGSTDGENWTLIQAVSITNTSYNDYTVDMQGSGYTYLKLDVEGTQQLRIKYMTITFAEA